MSPQREEMVGRSRGQVVLEAATANWDLDSKSLSANVPLWPLAPHHFPHLVRPEARLRRSTLLARMRENIANCAPFQPQTVLSTVEESTKHLASGRPAAV